MTADATPAVDAGALTVKQVARCLQLSESTVRRMIKADELPHFNHGQAYRIPRLAFERWLLKEAG